MTIGERLYALRKERNISQEELANELNVSRQSVSKWETNQSMPDFDKVVALCKFFGITTDELLTGKKDIVQANELDTKSTYARNLAIAIGLYIFSAVLLIVCAAVFDQPIVGVCLLLTLVAVATGLIIYNSVRYGKKAPESEDEKRENSQLKVIYDIVGLVGIVLYFVISFLTRAWYITWVIFIIIPAVNSIIKLLFSFKDDKKEEAGEEVNNNDQNN
ncbi:MAG: helix-turn-helix domain-containing protein [Clostridiales bacterium]|nr:helix-turn-helix domain-containing protein [Clostridiales bacterium]